MDDAEKEIGCVVLGTLSSEAGRRAIHAMHRQRRLNILIDDIEPQSKMMPVTERDVTPGSVYAHIDHSLGPWGQ
jgi:hypothetical protein